MAPTTRRRTIAINYSDGASKKFKNSALKPGSVANSEDSTKLKDAAESTPAETNGTKKSSAKIRTYSSYKGKTPSKIRNIVSKDPIASTSISGQNASSVAKPKSGRKSVGRPPLPSRLLESKKQSTKNSTEDIDKSRSNEKKDPYDFDEENPELGLPKGTGRPDSTTVNKIHRNKYKSNSDVSVGTSDQVEILARLEDGDSKPGDYLIYVNDVNNNTIKIIKLEKNTLGELMKKHALEADSQFYFFMKDDSESFKILEGSDAEIPYKRGPDGLPRCYCLLRKVG